MLTCLLGNELLGKLRKMRSLADDDEEEVKPSGPTKSQTVEQPAWMRALLERCKEWLGALPEVFRFLPESFDYYIHKYLYSRSARWRDNHQIVKTHFLGYSSVKKKSVVNSCTKSGGTLQTLSRFARELSSRLTTSVVC